MATPSIPIIQAHPWADLSSLTFYWGPPTNQGAGSIISYNLRCPATGYSTIVNSSTFGFTVSSLTNQTDYVYQLAAQNFYGFGPYATFNQVQPGILSIRTLCTGAEAIGNSTVTVSWSYNKNPNEGSARFFIVTATPSTPSISTIEYVAYQDQRSYEVSKLESDIYTFSVNAVNDAGWSLPTMSEPVTQ